MRCLWLLILSGVLCLGLIGCKKGGDTAAGPTDQMLDMKTKMAEQYAGKKDTAGGMQGGAGAMKSKMGQMGGMGKGQ